METENYDIYGNGAILVPTTAKKATHKCVVFIQGTGMLEIIDKT